MLRIIPLAMASLVVAFMLKAADMVNTSMAQTSAMAQEDGRQDTSGFGPHQRPWARNFITDENLPQEDGFGGAQGAAVNAAVLPLPSDFNEGDYREATQALARLRREEQALERREAELEMATALLEGTRLRARAEITRLATIRDELQGLINRLEAMEEADQDRLVAIYDGLKPSTAAELLSGQDTAMVVSILDDLQPRDVSTILDRMEPARAREVLEFIDQRRRVTSSAIQMN
jgi:flagellar motility protein MotE (MotC chaperone)